MCVVLVCRCRYFGHAQLYGVGARTAHGFAAPDTDADTDTAALEAVDESSSRGARTDDDPDPVATHAYTPVDVAVTAATHGVAADCNPVADGGSGWSLPVTAREVETAIDVNQRHGKLSAADVLVD